MTVELRHHTTLPPEARQDLLDVYAETWGYRASGCIRRLVG